MTAIGTTWPTLVDVAKRVDPDGRAPLIAEAMNAVNPILDDMPWIEGNLPTGHQGTIRTGLPAVAWRQLNYGVQPSKSTTKQVTDTCGILEAYSQLDKKVYEINGARDEFRMSEDLAFVESMSQTLASTLFYGNTDANPERFLGLAPRYSALSASPTNSGFNIIDAGGSDANDSSSIWLITWHERLFHGIYPKGQLAGLEYQNLGEQTHVFPDGSLMQVLRSHFTQNAGIHLKDWAACVRIANIDVSILVDAGTTTYTVELLYKMRDALQKIPLRIRNMGRKVFYCNPTVAGALDKLAMQKGIAQLTTDKLASGQPLNRFWGVPIRECDAILNTESRVV